MRNCDGCGEETKELSKVGEVERYEFCPKCINITAELQSEINDLDEICSRTFADGVQAIRQKFSERLRKLPDIDTPNQE